MTSTAHARVEGKSGNTGSQLRKQQLRMESGGEVARARPLASGRTEAAGRTTGAVSMLATRLSGMKGWTAGTSGLSSACSPPCSCAWHSAGCIMSMSSQPSIFAMPGQTYDASANCMNSTLASAISAVRKRWRRECMMDRPGNTDHCSPLRVPCLRRRRISTIGNPNPDIPAMPCIRGRNLHVAHANDASFIYT